MARYLYGETVGEPGRQALSYDQARDARYFSSLAANRALQGMGLGAQQQRFGNVLNAAQYAQAVRDAEQYQQRRAQEDAFNYLQVALQNKQFYDQLAQQKELSTASAGDQDFTQALRIAEGGDFGPEDIAALYPGLGRTRQSVLGRIAGNVRAEQSAEEQAAANLASQANMQLKAQQTARALANLGASKIKWPVVGRRPPSAAATAKVKAGDFGEFAPSEADLAGMIDALLKNRSYQQALFYNAGSGQFEPIVPPRSPRAALPPPLGAPQAGAGLPGMPPPGGPASATWHEAIFGPYIPLGDNTGVPGPAPATVTTGSADPRTNQFLRMMRALSPIPLPRWGEAESSMQPGQYLTEAEARAAGNARGTVVFLWDQKNQRYRPARLD